MLERTPNPMNPSAPVLNLNENDSKGQTGFPTRHSLVVEDANGYRLVALESTSHSIGRDLTNSIVLQSKAVSRQHALLLRVTNTDPNSYGFLIIDGNLQGKRSTNGIVVNGEKCHTRRLIHGDLLLFGNQVRARYLALDALSDEDYSKFHETINYEEVLSAVEPALSMPAAKATADLFDESFLVRLASFPEIIPSPMFEVNLNGELTYFNPAARNAFPDLAKQGMHHPVLQNLFTLVEKADTNILVREVVVADKIFEQSIHYISESDLIRSCVFDITERKNAESELRKRDRLLQSVAEATTHLLVNVGYDTAINKALATLGSAANVDRICVSVNHPHPDTGATATSLRYEWTRESIPSILRKPERHNQPYIQDHLKRWYHQLTDEKALRSLVRDLPATEQTFLEDEGVLALLSVPIIVNTEFWGFLELHQCSSESLWSPQEESIVFAMAASISAALQRQETEQIIHHQAFHDALTNLPNRILFNDRLSLALAAAQRGEKRVAVMFMDLDRFKTINDTLGHSVGDSLLQEVSQRLSGCLREGDTVARWGGDEFTILLPQIESVDSVTQTAFRILESLKAPLQVGTHELYISASIGIALFPDDGLETETLVQNADVALYRCKEQGRGRYELYTPTMNSKGPELFVLENNLRQVLDRNELLLYYQPKLDLATGRVIGLEALLRWQHPELGLVSPALFIPIAEETGLIVEIGEWAIRKACQQTVAWHRAGFKPLSVAVNLSARQFFQPNLVEMIAQALGDSGLEPGALEIEITETTAVKRINFTQTVLMQLQEMGVKIAMDDFGTGYSSLNYLKQLPLNTLKIDQSFIRDLQPHSKDREIIHAVIALGQGLQLKVVAEGVDSPVQLDILRQLNCDIVQGFLFSRPLNVAEITALLEEDWRKHGG